MKPRTLTALDFTLFVLCPLLIYVGCYVIMVKRIVYTQKSFSPWNTSDPPGTRRVIGADFGMLPPTAFRFIHQLDRTYVRPNWWTAVYYPSVHSQFNGQWPTLHY